MRTLHIPCLALIVMMVQWPESLGSERSLGAHQHGHGRVNLVLDGQDLWLELEAPGADIVGFEHQRRFGMRHDGAAIKSAKAANWPIPRVSSRLR